LLGVELWNRRSDGWAPSRTALELLARNEHLVPFATLDFHTARQFFPLAMAVEIAGALTEDGLLAALRARRCRPEAFGLPALRVARGPAFLAARAAERTRRRLARHVRKRSPAGAQGARERRHA